MPYPRNRTIMVHGGASHSSQASASTVPSHPQTLIERILALDNSSELAQQYTPLIMINPDQSGDSSSYVAVGHAHASLVDSALLHCKNDDGEPIFVKDRLPNGLGIMTDVLQLYMDARIRKDAKQYESHNSSEFNGDDQLELFQKRTVAFEYVTDYLMSTGIISHKHADVYPIYPFVGGEDSVNMKIVLAHVNRSAAPYLGIDSVGVHLNCYVCQHEGEHCGAGSSVKTNKIKGVWLAKRAPTKSHYSGGGSACRPFPS